MTPSAPPAERPAVHEHATPHHHVRLVGLDGTEQASVALPLAFSHPIRPDLIQRAVVAAQSHRRQPYGTAPTAGLRHSVEWSGKGRGVARTPRLMDSMRGAQAPNTVGGRPAHPPRPTRIWSKKINRKERQLAFASALAATRESKLASARGHEVPHGLHLPVVLVDPVEEIRSVAEARALLERLKLWADVERARSRTHLRSSGRARRRGRVRRTPRSLLLVTSGPGKALGFRNLAGVEVVPAPRLAVEDLAPGGDAGRLTLFSRAAVESLRSRLGEESP
ncbi:MAG TPA: 50S ribosomal protein L4 [Thermoplasmata archaeon]|jgi:large subunit ribosomal protein L4e|nr:50S ribosomal protein L4 [Thermoplasmata archaeon]